ncbi:putative lipid-transfer protein DIR1 [Magnolia sinica]|uniref:putative lipid-transfer protein DIR1 n=1 Tax=Magnolia sinica TaxID=86752 RepID=UPI00265A9422|nr:putative lipid-transfer protein DIR1 [Magnolia sinica]
MHCMVENLMQMANVNVGLVLVVLLAIAMEGGGAMKICDMDTTQLADCLPSIRGPSPSPPSNGCCDTIRTADLYCLCGYKNSYLLPSFGVDPKLAIQLPVKCGLTPPPECQQP